MLDPCRDDSCRAELCRDDDGRPGSVGPARRPPSSRLRPLFMLCALPLCVLTPLADDAVAACRPSSSAACCGAHSRSATLLLPTLYTHELGSGWLLSRNAFTAEVCDWELSERAASARWPVRVA